jgi:uncharacterized protein (DUF2164 family)
MKFSSNIGLKIHNRFDIQVKDAETMEVIQTAQAENIVLDRIYTRLLSFQSYFDQIVFGSGTGTLSPSRTTLFTRIGNKAAVTESLVRSYPTSVWTRSIRLGTEEFNGQTIREVGISDTTTNINTHALITDSEGNPLEVEKTDLKIIDIYATVFVEVYSVDSGCFFYDNGLRDYLTGGSAPNNDLRLRMFSDDDMTPLTATITSNSGEKSITLTVRFNVEHFNKDVRAIDWVGGGLRWLMPRTGVYTGTAKTNVELGAGDGSNDTFVLPNKEVTSLTVKVDGVITTAYTRTFDDKIILDTAPANGLLVTADYTTKYIPKDSDHVLDVTMKIAFGASQPSPVVPDPIVPNDLPGPQTLSGGDTTDGGYFGEVSALDFISGEDLCSAIGLTAGTLQESDAGWLKYYSNNEILYVAKRTFRYNLSWDDINAAGAIFGDKKITIGNHFFAVRALSSREWDKLIYPVHVNYGTWASFTDADLRVTLGYGRAAWTSTPSGSNRISRGRDSVEHSRSNNPSSADSSQGFRPVLVYLYTLPS